MKTNTPLRRRNGFTLVELLVVIGIILILMGLTLVVVPIVKKQAQYASANNLTKQIAAAVNAYHAEYAKFPPLRPSGAEAPDPSKDQWVGDPGMGAPLHNNALFYTLRKIPKGPNLNDAANPRLVTYLSYHPAKMSSAGNPRDGFYDRGADGGAPPSDQDGCLYDPWGREYGVILDTTSDERIDMEGIYLDLAGADRVSGKAPRVLSGAFSMGVDEALGKEGNRTFREKSDKSDDVVSWE